MSLWASPRDLAIDALEANADRRRAAEQVDAVFRQLQEPDADMIGAGIDELERAGLAPPTLGRRVMLVQAIWRAMLDKART